MHKAAVKADPSQTASEGNWESQTCRQNQIVLLHKPVLVWNLLFMTQNDFLLYTINSACKLPGYKYTSSLTEKIMFTTPPPPPPHSPHKETIEGLSSCQ